MDRIIETEINGKKYYLNYSVEVMFEVIEKYGNIQDAIKRLDKFDKDGFEVLKWFAVKMATDGELVRREVGYDKCDFLKEKEVTLRMKPIEYVSLKEAVIAAINNGYLRETETKDEDVDVGLAELNEKKTKAKG